MSHRIKIIDRLTYCSLLMMGTIVMGRFIKKVVYPWAKSTWEYRKEYELYRQSKLKHFCSQMDALIALMNDTGKEIQNLNLELKQRLTECVKALEIYRVTLKHMDQEHVWIKALSKQLSPTTFLDETSCNSYFSDKHYKKEILECELKSLKGLLLNRLYYSQGKIT
jgi:hypothetical protein